MGLGGSPAGVLLGYTGVHARGHDAAAGVSGFRPALSDGLEVWFRAPAGRMPDVLEIGMRGRRHPRVEAVIYGYETGLVAPGGRSATTE